MILFARILVDALVDALSKSNKARFNHGEYREADPQVAHHPEHGADRGALVAEARALAGLAAQSRAEARAAEAAGIEDRWSDQPILARKACLLIRLPDRSFGFRALTFTRHLYGVVSMAECLAPAHPDHQVPADDCDCGYHAVPPDLKIPVPTNMEPCLPYMVYLLVELTGEVVETERGYRAEKQRVVEVQLPPCLACDKPSEWVSSAREGMGWCWFPCADHAPNDAWSRAELAETLGVSVTS